MLGLKQINPLTFVLLGLKPLDLKRKGLRVELGRAHINRDTAVVVKHRLNKTRKGVDLKRSA